MRTFFAEETIRRPAHEIWSYAARIDQHPQWMSVTTGEVLEGDGTRVGSRGRERLALGPMRWDIVFTVRAAQRGRLLRWRSHDDPRLDLEVTLDLERVDEYTARAVYTSSVQLKGPWRLLTPLVAFEGPAGVRRELRQLKAQVEGAAVERNT